MIIKRVILSVIISFFSFYNSYAKPKSDREYWVERAYEMSKPVLENLSRETLHRNMPIEQFENAGREGYAHLEAVGRLLCGISSWLELPADNSREGALRAELLALAHKGIANSVNPESDDYLNFNKGSQPLVDAAFLAQAFIRSPNNLWGGLDEKTKERVISEMKSTRAIKPSYNNWLLFSAMVEAFLVQAEGSCDLMRADYAFRQMENWYVGDGQYKDGEVYHNDYYNSFVIQPMLLDAGMVFNGKYGKDAVFSDDNMAKIVKRATRYAEFLERSISPEGTFPVYGRSILYRTGCMQSLAQAALLKILPEEFSEGQVRAALTIVMKRMLDAKDTYRDGWLTMGFCGSQKESGEYYLCTGSMYLASTVFLPLGLPENDPFWQSDAQMWTSQKAWSGEAFNRDSSIK